MDQLTTDAVNTHVVQESTSLGNHWTAAPLTDVNVDWQNTSRKEISKWSFKDPLISITVANITILTIGMIGNLLILVVVLRKGFRGTAFGVHLICLAVFDCFALITQSILTEFEPTDLISCKTIGYINTMTEIQSSWTLVTIAVERVLVVAFPHKAQASTNAKRAVIVQIGVSSTVAIACVGVLFTSTVHKKGKAVECILRNILFDKRFKFVPHLIFDLLLYSIIPCTILIVLTCVLIVGLRRRMAFRRNSSSAGDDSDENRRLNTMLIFTCLMYAITTLPVSLYLTVADLLEMGSASGPKPADYVEVSLFLLQKCNHAGNFFVYYLTGSKFRDEFKKICKNDKTDTLHGVNSSSCIVKS